MHRFYITPEDWNPDALVLHGTEAHHARDVLRLRPGGRAVLFDGRGREITAEITKVTHDEIELRKLHEGRTPPLPCQITLAQAIPKGKNMDLIVQKAVEIGAAEIAPLISERTIIHLDPASAIEKQSKWQQVAIEAAKQSGQNWVPKVYRPRKLSDFFSDSVAAVSDHRVNASRAREGAQKSDVAAALVSSAEPSPRPLAQPPLQPLRLIGSLQSDAMHLKRVLANYEREHHARPSSVLMCIGPEGDFTPAELNLARSHGCRPITLGPIILRVETAAIYCLSVLSYELLAEAR